MFYYKNNAEAYASFTRKVMSSRPVRHIAVLSLIAMAFYFSLEIPFYVESLVMWYRLGYGLLCLLLCYLNMYVLVPRFLFNGKPAVYRCLFACMIFIALLGVIVGRYIFASMDQTKYEKAIFIPPIIQSVFFATIFVSASTAIKLFHQWVRDTVRINELTRANLQSELEQLKNQINPHFLFNMLNNVNVLTQRDPAKASQVVMKLSDLLRYQLYDSGMDKVWLTADIRFINDSLDLEKIRRDNFEYTVKTSGSAKSVQVPPSIFITFVENAIKHSLCTESPSFVDVNFDVTAGHIDFSCVNSRPKKRAIKQKGGLGLKNAKRRLELLFPEHHELIICDEETHYTVKLILIL